MEDMNLPKSQDKFWQLKQKRHQLILENLTDLISCHTPEGIYQYISPVCESLLGYPCQVLIGQSAEALCHPEDCGLIKQFYEQLQHRWTVDPVVYRIRHHGGHYLWLETAAKVIPDPQTGAMQEIICVSRDITKTKQTQDLLKSQKTPHQFILENLPDFITTHNQEGIYQYVSPICQFLLGYLPEDLIGQSIETFCHPEDRHLVTQFYCQFKSQTRVLPVTYRISHRNGHYLWIETNGNPIIHAQTGEIQEIICVSRDITKRQQTAEALSQAETQYRKIFEKVSQGIFQLSLQGYWLEVNPALAQLYGYDHPQDLLESISDRANQLYVNPQRHDTLLNLLNREGKVIDFESEIYRKDGSKIWIRENIWPVHDQWGHILYYEGTAQETSDNSPREDQPDRHTLEDPLTHLPNREWFCQQLQTAIARANEQNQYSFAILLINLDSFHLLNENLGQLGDGDLLPKVSQCLQTIIRTKDKLARLGGDEFVILIENQSIRDILLITKRILTQLSYPFELGKTQVFVRSTIGITLSKIGYKKPENVIRDAHLAMYRAKGEGKEGYTIFNPTLKAAALTRLQLETDLRQAIQKQQLLLHYQPIIELRSGLLSGFEALLRWQHPTRGMISPAQFIPIAEESGLINSIGWWVIEQACYQLEYWQKLCTHATHLLMNINVSAQQLKQAKWDKKLEQLLQATGINGSHLKLEITESCLLETATVETERVQELKELGLGLCIDDFGTGYSSLSRLHEFPIDTLKIDRSFIGKLSVLDKAIVPMIINLAHTLDMNVVAEGIETREQFNELQGLGCELGQGYFFSKPMNHEQATLWVKNYCTMPVT